MPGITDLKKLLKNMQPTLLKGKYVFCSISESDLKHLRISPVFTFKEKEGISIVLSKQAADKNKLKYSGVWALITLNVYSDLSAVGFLAIITRALADARISTNVVSAFYHDHLFVPTDKAEMALDILLESRDI